MKHLEIMILTLQTESGLQFTVAELVKNHSGTGPPPQAAPLLCRYKISKGYELPREVPESWLVAKCQADCHKVAL